MNTKFAILKFQLTLEVPLSLSMLTVPNKGWKFYVFIVLDPDKGMQERHNPSSSV